MSTSKLPISRINFLGLGLWMMKLLMRKTKMASLEKLKSYAKQLNVKFIACTASCGVLGLEQSDLENVDEYYIQHAGESRINLFV